MLYVNHFDTIIPEIAEWCLLLDAISSVQAYQKRMLGTILPSVGISTHRRERFYNNVSRSTWRKCLYFSMPNVQSAYVSVMGFQDILVRLHDSIPWFHTTADNVPVTTFCSLHYPKAFQYASPPSYGVWQLSGHKPWFRYLLRYLLWSKCPEALTVMNSPIHSKAVVCITLPRDLFPPITPLQDFNMFTSENYSWASARLDQMKYSGKRGCTRVFLLCIAETLVLHYRGSLFHFITCRVECTTLVWNSFAVGHAFTRLGSYPPLMLNDTRQCLTIHNLVFFPLHVEVHHTSVPFLMPCRHWTLTANLAKDSTWKIFFAF